MYKTLKEIGSEKLYKKEHKEEEEEYRTPSFMRLCKSVCLYYINTGIEYIHTGIKCIRAGMEYVNIGVDYINMLLEKAINQTYESLSKPVVLRPLGKETYRLSFNYQGRTYHMCIRVSQKTKPGITLRDEHGNNLTPFLGPNVDGYGMSLCPNELGCKKIIINTSFSQSIVTENKQFRVKGSQLL